MEQCILCFYSWVSTYYMHLEHMCKTHNPVQLDTTPLLYPAPPCMHPATLDVIMPDMLMGVSWPSPIQGSEALLHGMLLNIMLEQMCHMLLDPEAGHTLPQCKVIIVWGKNTLWKMVCATWAVKKLYKEHKSVGQVRHVLEVMEMPGVNHFVSSFHSMGVHVSSAAGRDTRSHIGMTQTR